MTRYGGSVEDVANRLKKVRHAFSSLSGVWKSKEISRKTKPILCSSIVQSTLLYGCECWALTKVLNCASKFSSGNFCEGFWLSITPMSSQT